MLFAYAILAALARHEIISIVRNARFCSTRYSPVGNPDEVTVQDMKKALNFLRQRGFNYLKSVKGGITAWSDEIDHRVAKY